MADKTVVYRVQAPDGRILRIEGPEGASEEQLTAIAAQHYNAAKAEPADRRGQLPGTAKASALGVVKGIVDLPVGAAQFLSKFPLLPGSVSSSVDDYIRLRDKVYSEATEGHETALARGRIAGNVFTGVGAGMGLRAAPTLIGRMGQGAKLGGTLGAAAPVDPDAESYLTSKAVQAGGGAALGFVAPGAVEGIIRGTGAAINSLTSAVRGMKSTVTGATSRTNVESALAEQLQKSGVDWSRVPAEAREALVEEVRRAIRGGGALDDESARRLGDFLRLKMSPTQGQLTRDPLQFAREVNYSKADFGKPLAERFNQQNQQLIGSIDELRTGTGARATDPYGAGQRVISDLRSTDAATKGRVDAAYTQARTLAGLDSEVPAQPVADRLGKIVEEFGDDKIPGAVGKRLQEFGFLGGRQTKLLTVREAEKLKTLIGNNIDNPNTPSGKALTLLKQSVDEAMNGIGDDAGSQAAGAFRQARGLAAQRFEALRRTPGMEKALERDVTPEKYIESQIIRGDVKDVANLMMLLGKDARAEVRAAVLDWIKGRGVAGVEDTSKFTQSGFNRALNTIGERKLNLIFAGDKEAVKQLQALGRVGAYIQNPPVASGVNYSNTFTSGLDFLDQISRIAALGLPFKPGDIMRSPQAVNALTAAPVSTTPLIPSGLLDLSAKRAGLMSSGAAGLLTPSVMEDRTRRGLLSFSK